MGNVGDISFKAASQQLGNAVQQFALATWRAPFSGGRTRMVLVGIPVLFLTTGLAAAIFYVMKTILQAVGKEGVHRILAIYNYFYKEKRVTSYQQPPLNPNLTTSQIPINRVENNKPNNQVSPSIIRQPLPIDAAKERNASLAQLLELVEKYVIDPWIIQNEKFLAKTAEIEDPFLKQMKEPETLKKWLKSMALWKLGEAWDKLENQYVKMNTPPPPTIESIQAQIQAQKLDEILEKQLLQCIQDKDVPQFQKTVTESECFNTVKVTLMALSLQLDILLKKTSASDKAKKAEQEIMLKKFAITMHHGVATTLSQMTLIIEGWLEVIKHISPSDNSLTWSQFFPDAQQNNEDVAVQNFDNLVLKVSKTVTQELSNNYLQPLWDKKQTIRQKNLEEGLSEIENQEVIKQFLDGTMDEKRFLANIQSHSLSTAQTSQLALMRAMQSMENQKGDLLKTSMSNIPYQLLLQIEPTLNLGLNKLAEMISQISFERTVPKLVGYFQKLLHCCTAMQKVRENYDQQNLHASFINLANQEHPLEGALMQGQIEKQKAKEIAQLYNDRQRQISGRAIVEQLGSSMHKTVRVDDTYSKVQEETWIRISKERLKGIFRLRIAEYTKEHWLFTLFEKVASGVSLDLFPGMESMAKILALGIQTFIEEEATEAIQKNLNTLTSTAFISKTLSVTIVSGLIEKYKKEEDWKTNLPMLRYAFSYLADKEQEELRQHLSFKFPMEDIYQARLKDLTQKPTEDLQLLISINTMKEQEKKFDEALKQIEEARKHFKVPNQDKEVIATLEEGYGKLKRERDLKEFARVKNLVLYIVSECLNEPLNFTGGENLKKIILTVIQEVMTLLTYQELVKHWIFTLIDLVLDELEENKKAENQQEQIYSKKETPSLLDFIESNQKKELLEQLVGLVETSLKQEEQGWFNAQSWITWSAKKVSWLVPGTIWEYIEKAFKEDLRFTPKYLQEKIFIKMGEFGTNPNGLSALLVEALSENIADPRPEKPEQK